MGEPALLSDLPKLFDRNFSVGFVLPAILLIAGSYFVFWAFDLRPQWMTIHDLNLTAVLAMLALVWVIAITLLAINRPYVRFLEGYGRFNPLRWLFSRHMKTRFDEDADSALKDQQDVEAARKVGSAEPRLPGHEKRLLHAVENYPDKKEWVLPTKFGNQHRAIEVYSRVVYGLEAEVPAAILKNVRQVAAEAKQLHQSLFKLWSPTFR